MENRAMRPRLLATVEDFTECGMISALLEDAGIPVLVKDIGGGGFLKVAMGFTVFGQELYVDEENFERAEELLKAYFDRDSDGSDGIKKHPFGIF